MSEAADSPALEKSIPVAIKILVAVALVAVLGFGVARLAGCGRTAGTDKNAGAGPLQPPPSNIPDAFPERVVTQWPGISIRIDSVSRHQGDTIVAHWTYRNEAGPTAQPFQWGPEQPDIVALSSIRDASGRDYTVAVSGTGIPLCSSIRTGDKSMRIPGGGSLPAWASFSVPANAPLPLTLLLHGGAGPDTNGAPVPVLSFEEQSALAHIARETSWPDIWIQLDEVARTGDGQYRVRWRYLNRNLEKPFAWTRDQPDLPGRTQLFDFSSGTYRPPSSSSSIHAGSGPTQIVPGGELPAEAIFDNVQGNHFELIFHGALPVFYDQQGTN